MAGNLRENEKPSDNKIGHKLIEVLDNLLSVGEWNSSLFLKTVKKRLYDVRENAYSAMGESANEIKAGNDSDGVRELPLGCVRVYVLLYQMDGTKLSNWQYAIKSLVGHNISRPTYCEERYAQELIRSKKDVERYGYAVIRIPEDSIYNLKQASKDILGHEMLMLKEGVIKLSSIEGFIHANKRRYVFHDGDLVYKEEIN